MDDPQERDGPRGDETSVSPDDERAIRNRVRQRLLMREEEERQLMEEKRQNRDRQAEVERLRWQIIEQETEGFHRQRGRKKYITSGGEVKWLTPEEFHARRSSRSRLRDRSRRLSRRWRPGQWFRAQLRVMTVSFASSLIILLFMMVVIYAIEFI